MMIKLLLCDVDGTLTDGIYQTTENGEISKNFFTRDFHGLWMLWQSGVQIGIITAATDEVIDHQCRRGAKYADLIKGAKDKYASVFRKYVDPRENTCNFDWDEIAFIGDDVFDLNLLQAVGLAACPRDAIKEVRELIDSLDGGFFSGYRGGQGSVRDFAEYILRVNNAEAERDCK